MKVSSVATGSHTVRGPLQVVAVQPVVLEHHQAASNAPVRKLITGVSAGALSQQAWAGFQATNTTSFDDMTKLPILSGLAPEHAPGVAKQAMDVIHAEPTKMLLIAVSAGGGFWAAIEMGRSILGLRMSRFLQLVLALVVGAAAALAYHYLRARGIAS